MQKIIIRHVKSFFTGVGVFITLRAILNLIFGRPQFDAYDNVSWIVGFVLLSVTLAIENCVEWKKTGIDRFSREVKQVENSRKREVLKKVQRLFVCIGVCIVGNLGLSMFCDEITFTALDCIELVVGVTAINLLVGIYGFIGKGAEKKIV